MFCERCGNRVEESEKFCAQCGAPLPPMEPADTAGTPEAVIEAESAETKAVESVPTAEAVAAESAPAVEAAPAAESAPAAEAAPAVEEFVPTPSLAVPQVQEAPIAPAVPVDEPEGSKKPKKKKTPWIIAACVAALAAVCVVGVIGLRGLFKRSFSSPAEYYRHVEEQNVSALAEAGGAYYGLLFPNMTYADEGSANMEFAIELGEGGKELLQLFTVGDVDFTWLEDVSLKLDYAVQENLLGYDFSLGLNKVDLLTLKMILDMAGGDFYMQIPELAAEYIAMDLDEYGTDWAAGLEAQEEMRETLEALQKIMPETEQVEKLLEKYLKLALSGVDDVEKNKTTVEAGEVEQKCTELVVTVDGKCLSKMLEAVLKELPKDKELKKLCVSMVDGLMAMGETYGVDGEYAWKELVEEAEQLLEDLDELKDIGDVLVMKVYVDDKDRIIGRELELLDDRETVAVINLLALEKGGKLGYEYSVETVSGYGMEMALTGSGRRSGDMLTGDFELVYDGIPVLEWKISDFDTKKAEQGYLNGRITMTFSRQISSLLSESLSYYGEAYASMLADLEFTMDVEMAEGSGKFIFGIDCGGKNLGSVSISAESGKKSGISIPDASDIVSSLDDEENLAAWLESIDWAGFAGRLEAAHLPDEIVDQVKEFAEMIENGGIQGMPDYSDDPFGGDYYGDSRQPDDFYGDDFGEGSNPGDDPYGDLWGEENQLEQLLATDEWAEELKSWNAQCDGTGMSITTEADGNTLVFTWHLPDDDFYGSLDGTTCAIMAEGFLDSLAQADFLDLFQQGYGISLDAVRCRFVKYDGTELCSEEIN